MDEVNNFRGLKVQIAGPQPEPTEALPSHLERLGHWSGLDHVFVDVDTLRTLAGDRAADPQWESGLLGMVEYARGAGWVDGAGRVRVHVEYTSAPWAK